MRTIDTLTCRTILPASLEHETPASSWGLDQLALRNCSWFPLRFPRELRQTDMPLRWLRANDLLAVQEEKTRCPCSPNCRERVKSESWVQPFGEFVLPAILRRIPGDRPPCKPAPCKPAQRRSQDRFCEVMWPPTAVPQTVNEEFPVRGGCDLHPSSNSIGSSHRRRLRRPRFVND